MKDTNEKLQTMPFLDHFRELRSRLIKIFIAVIPATLLAFAVAGPVYAALATPLLDALPPEDKNLIFITPVEPFFVLLKVSIVLGLVFVLPFVLYQIWAFVSPALYKREKRGILPLILSGCLSFALGAAFCYFIVLPLGLKALIGFDVDNVDVRPQITMDAYFTVALKLITAFGLVFQMPVLTVFLSSLGLLDAAMLLRYKNFAVVAIFVIAAILTPPDVITQISLALPMLLLYGLCILLAKYFHPAILPETDTPKTSQ